ncbi:GILT-like protein 1 [Planococcus citri]|uniref:GILT-like protein 1 n=1 Tax=Planococcus citri TaxID=170843 RepID=UPI0031F91799
MFELFYACLAIFMTATRGQLLYTDYQEAQKVNVSIFYESLCPDSVKFITAKFYPIYGYLRPHVNLHLVPFGKAEVISEKEYRCQHGPRECLRNRLQACVLLGLTDQDEQIKFVDCAMKSPALADYEQCAGFFGIDWTSVQKCATGTLGYQLMLAAQAETRAKTDGPSFVPTIVYNDVFDKEDSDDSFSNPLEVLCRKLTVKPAVCNGTQQSSYITYI